MFPEEKVSELFGADEVGVAEAEKEAGKVRSDEGWAVQFLDLSLRESF